MKTNWKRFTTVGWTGQDWIALSKSKKGLRIDPYLVWADATKFADLGNLPKRWIPIVIELQGTTAFKFAIQVGKPYWKSKIEVSPFFRDPSRSLESTTFCTAVVSAKFFSDPKIDELLNQIVRYELGLPVMSSVDPVNHVDRRYGSATVPGKKPRVHKTSKDHPTVVGIIDNGLAFAHSRFRERGGLTTRVAYFCNQGYANFDILTPNDGRELTKDQIDKFMGMSLHNGLVNEDEVYRLAGYQEVAERCAHGTHVMDLLCGEDPANSNEESSQIICVQIQLPCRRTNDTSGRSMAFHALNGLRYILDRADALTPGHAEPCPVVINFSYGNVAGPHNGSSMLERAIDELIEKRGKLSVVLAAGNSHLSRCHAQFQLNSSESEKELKWRILPDDATPNFMEIWVPSGNEKADISIQVTAPCGTKSHWINKNNISILQNGDDVLCTVVYFEKVATGDGKMILLAVAPTSTLHPLRSTAPCGEWLVRLRNNASQPVDINAWIQRDDTPIANRVRGRQSRFEDADYELYDAAGRPIEDDNEKSYIRRTGTLNAIATGRRTVIVGGFRGSDGKIAPYSASGGNLQMDQQDTPINPDGTAISSDSPARFGVLAAGTRSGSIVAMCGTSVAAPQVARTLTPQARKMNAIQPARRQMQSLKEGRAPATPIRLPRPGKNELDRQAVAAQALKSEQTNGKWWFPTNSQSGRFGAGRIVIQSTTLKVKR